MAQLCPYCRNVALSVAARLKASLFGKEIRCPDCQTRLKSKELNLWLLIPLPCATYYFGYGWGMYLILFVPLLFLNLLYCYFSPLKIQGLRRFKKNN